MATRPRGGTQTSPLSLAEVMEAALFVTERNGLMHLTVRGVAEALGVTSPAIYHYVAHKVELIDRVCEHVARSVDLDVDPDMSWDDQIVDIVLGMDRTFARYPGVASQVLSLVEPAPSPAALRINDRVMGLLLGAGFPNGEAVELLATVHFLVSGWLLGRPPVLDGLPARVAPNPSGHPALTAVATEVVATPMTSALLETGLRRLLDGFAGASQSRIPDRRRRRPRSTRSTP